MIILQAFHLLTVLRVRGDCLGLRQLVGDSADAAAPGLGLRVLLHILEQDDRPGVRPLHHAHRPQHRHRLEDRKEQVKDEARGILSVVLNIRPLDLDKTHSFLSAGFLRSAFFMICCS